MKRIELYRIDTDKFAALVAATCACAGCPMRDDCTEFENTYDRTEVNTDTCFGMWRDYFRKDPYVLESANDVSELLESVVDCEKCPINEECVRDGVFGDSAECEYMFECWLSAEITPAGATCRKMRQVGTRPQPGDVVKIIATVTPQPIEGNMIRVITKNTGVVIYVSPDEIEAE